MGDVQTVFKGSKNEKTIFFKQLKYLVLYKS